MGKQKEYHKIVNFTTNGDLGISVDVIEEITKQAIKDVEGAKVSTSHTVFNKPVEVKFNKRGALTIKASIVIDYGYNVGETCSRVQEKIEHDLLYMTEIIPTKVDVQVSDVSL